MGHNWGTQGDINVGIFAGNGAKFSYASAKLSHLKINTLKRIKQQKQQQKNCDWIIWPLLVEEKSNPWFQLHANHFWWTISNPPFNSFHTDISSVLYIHMHGFLYFYVCASPVAVWTLFVKKQKKWWKVLALSCSRHMFLFVCFLFCFKVVWKGLLVFLLFSKCPVCYNHKCKPTLQLLSLCSHTFWQLFLALTTGLNQRLSRVSLLELNQNCSPEHHDCTDFGLKSLFFTLRVQDLSDNTIMVLSTCICTCTVSLVECTNWYSFVTFSVLCLFLEWIFWLSQ